MTTITTNWRERTAMPLWPDAGEILSLNRTSAYALAKSGDLKTIRVGKLIRVTTRELRRFLGELDEA